MTKCKLTSLPFVFKMAWLLRDESRCTVLPGGARIIVGRPNWTQSIVFVSEHSGY